ncbi:hypothetical protein LTR62_002887 [Meristemomyces frigidus]|uniref:Uncharacterized protein n=1 Tax=Meristemomyces frigidus TaxID=1508187 RepID=A0AAN7TRZ8_9PEZI|nr:hypothetical protein LTR62_002887 [Meristemomyces frigidus]
MATHSNQSHATNQQITITVRLVCGHTFHFSTTSHQILQVLSGRQTIYATCPKCTSAAPKPEPGSAFRHAHVDDDDETRPDTDECAGETGYPTQRVETAEKVADWQNDERSPASMIVGGWRKLMALGGDGVNDSGSWIGGPATHTSRSSSRTQGRPDVVGIDRPPRSPTSGSNDSLPSDHVTGTTYTNSTPTLRRRRRGSSTTSQASRLSTSFTLPPSRLRTNSSERPFTRGSDWSFGRKRPLPRTEQDARRQSRQLLGWRKVLVVEAKSGWRHLERKAKKMKSA